MASSRGRLLLCALALLLAVVLLMLSRQVRRSGQAQAGAAGSTSDGLNLGVRQPVAADRVLSVDMEAFEDRLSAIESRLDAVEMSHKDMHEGAGAASADAISVEDFRRMYGDEVLKILDEREALTAIGLESEMVWSRVRYWLRQAVKTDDLSMAQKEHLHSMLLSLRLDVIKLEAKISPPGSGIPPSRGTAEYELWRSEWDRLLTLWEDPIAQILKLPPTNVMPREIVLDMASPRLDPPR